MHLVISLYCSVKQDDVKDPTPSVKDQCHTERSKDIFVAALHEWILKQLICINVHFNKAMYHTNKNVHRSGVNVKAKVHRCLIFALKV